MNISILRIAIDPSKLCSPQIICETFLDAHYLKLLDYYSVLKDEDQRCSCDEVKY